MTKMKTHRGAAKRLKCRGNGSLKKRSTNRAHILTKKAQKRKRQLRGSHVLAAADVNGAERMLCIK